MLISDVMTKEVISISPDTSIEAVSRLMIENRVHGVPVVENGVPVGIITETDFFTKGSMSVYLPEYIDFLKKESFFSKISEEEKEKIKLLLNTTAKDVMTSPCVTIAEKANVDDFFKLVREKKLVTVPVVNEEEKLVGIITLVDIVNLMKLDI